MTTLSQSEQRRGRGRPTLFNAETSRILFDAIERGLPYRQAAALAGISYDTFNRWRNDALDTDASPELCDFCKELAAAKARGADALLTKIKTASDKDWKAAAWILSKWFPKHWGASPEADIPLELQIAGIRD